MRFLSAPGGTNTAYCDQSVYVRTVSDEGAAEPVPPAPNVRNLKIPLPIYIRHGRAVSERGCFPRRLRGRRTVIVMHRFVTPSIGIVIAPDSNQGLGRVPKTMG